MKFLQHLLLDQPINGKTRSLLSAKRNWHVFLARACYSFDYPVFIVTNFNLATVVFFDNVVALHFYMMTRKPTRFLIP